MLKPVRQSSRALRVVFAACAAIGLVLGGAASGPTYVNTTDRGLRPINYGTLVNEELTIKAVDQSFTLKGGEQFRTPFMMNLWSTTFEEKTLANQYQKARAIGAKPVLVYIQGVEKPLYGLMIFNQAINAAFGPGSQSYYVRISKDKIDNARFGGISVAYEMMDWRNSWSDDYGAKHEDNTWYSWMLWLSATPL